jgi:hypothetical protein
MKQQIIAVILITLCAIYFYIFGKYDIVSAIYNTGAPVDTVMLLAACGLSMGVIGLVLLLSGDKR